MRKPKGLVEGALVDAELMVPPRVKFKKTSRPWLMEEAIGVKKPMVSWAEVATRGRKTTHPKPKWRSK